MSDSPLRIAISVPAFLEAPDFGGPVTKVSLLAEGLVARGHEVTVITTDFGRQRSRVAPGVRHEAGYDAHYLRSLWRYRWSPIVSIRQLQSVQWNFDIVHVCAVRDGLSVGMSVRAIRNRTPYVVEPMGMGVARLRNARLKKIADGALTRFQLARARLVITTSHREKRDLLGVYKLADVRVRPNPVLMEPIHPTQKAPPADGVPFELLFVGRICRTKNLDALLEAIEPLANVHLTIAGPDDRDGTRQAIERLVERIGRHRVTVLDWVDADERNRLIDAADICVLPSLTENFGNFAVEAARGRRALIVTNRTGVAEILEGSAAIVEPTAQALRQAIEALISDPELRIRLADDAMELVNQFEVPAVAALQERIYRDALGD